MAYRMLGPGQLLDYVLAHEGGEEEAAAAYQKYRDEKPPPADEVDFNNALLGMRELAAAANISFADVDAVSREAAALFARMGSLSVIVAPPHLDLEHGVGRNFSEPVSIDVVAVNELMRVMEIDGRLKAFRAHAVGSGLLPSEAALSGADSPSATSNGRSASGSPPSGAPDAGVGRNGRGESAHEPRRSPQSQQPQIAEGQTANDERAVLPEWRASERKLTFGTRLLKHYGKHPATNQIAVLAAFQAAGWPPSVAAPVRGDQIRETVRALNKTIGKKAPIRFAADGTGQGIRWDRVGG